MNFRENMASLHTLSNEYYQHRISFVEYREQRSQLLKLIDEDLNGIKTVVVENENNVSLMDRALSFLKIDKIKETG